MRMTEPTQRMIDVGAWTLHQLRCLDPVVCRAEPSEQERTWARAVIVAVVCDDEARAALANLDAPGDAA